MKLLEIVYFTHENFYDHWFLLQHYFFLFLFQNFHLYKLQEEQIAIQAIKFIDEIRVYNFNLRILFFLIMLLPLIGMEQ